MVRDFDFHPDEPTVRIFGAARVDVPRLDDEAFVARVCYDTVVLHHYAWASRWFKVNVTTDCAGNLIETGSDEGGIPFAFNIDIATPMLRDKDQVFAVDLFTDVFVRADGRSYVIGDREEATAAFASGLISRSERRASQHAVNQLVEIIEQGRLMHLLNEACPVEPCCPTPAPPIERVAIEQVPLLAPYKRSTW